jgi:intracellular sulfur oxidation DsrE/DsrF family protein
MTIASLASKLALAVLLATSIAGTQVVAQGSAPPDGVGVPGEPIFTEHRLVLQLSDADDARQTQILNNAVNVLEVYGPDKVAIEVVTFGPGVELLHEGNKNADRIHSLSLQGVKFDVCENTVHTIERNTGKPYALNKLARPVKAGVVQIMTLAEHGYTVVRP